MVQCWTFCRHTYYLKYHGISLLILLAAMLLRTNFTMILVYEFVISCCVCFTAYARSFTERSHSVSKTIIVIKSAYGTYAFAFGALYIANVFNRELKNEMKRAKGRSWRTIVIVSGRKSSRASFSWEGGRRTDLWEANLPRIKWTWWACRQEKAHKSPTSAQVVSKANVLAPLVDPQNALLTADCGFV